tara:strand:- start:115 stop:696 length:582 start_codon:yes stop_codon:yes gene_type:complete
MKTLLVRKQVLVNLVLFPAILLFLVGCTAPLSHVNMDLKPGDLTFSDPHRLKITAEYKVNGKSQSNYDDEVLAVMEEVLSDVGFAKATSKNPDGEMHIVVDLKADYAKAASKGLIAGFTWGLIGYSIEDVYTMDVELILNGETVNKTGYKQSIVTIAGLGQGGTVGGMSQLPPAQAMEKAAQQLILQFLNDLN